MTLHFADVVAAVFVELGAQFFQASDVQIDRAVAELATAGDGDDGSAALGEKRAEDADAGAHGGNDFVACFGAAFTLDDEVEGSVEVRAVADGFGGGVVAVDVAAQFTQ